MRRRLIPTVLLLFIFVGLDGCKFRVCPRNTGCVSPTLDSAANVAVSGQAVTLTNNSTSQSGGFSLTFSNVGNLTCNDVSIDVTAAYGFVVNGSSFIPSPVTSTMPQYSCLKSGSQMTLSSAPPLTEGFHPWVDNFNINMGTTVFTVTVNTPASATQLLTRGDQSEMYLDSSFTGCGLRGTVLQRVFDCSKKIMNYGVMVERLLPTPATSNAACDRKDSDGPGCSYYTQFTDPNTDNADLFWFVVGCPDTGGSSTIQQQSCTWLTPIVPAGNPALDVGAGVPTFQLSMFTNAYQNRLLWSGKMINGGTGYNFAQSNGFTFTDGSEQYTPGGSNPGTTPSSAQPAHTSPSVCIATPTGAPLAGGAQIPTSDANTRDLVSSTSGATIAWQIASYAMQNILAGGTPTVTSGVSVCPTTGVGPFGGRPYCNMPSSQPPYNVGFSAINVPSFSMTDTSPVYPYLEILWSSSSSGNGYAWAFVALSVTDGGNDSNDGPSNLLGARCVSPAWF